jgi:hypothetical protein
LTKLWLLAEVASVSTDFSNDCFAVCFMLPPYSALVRDTDIH